MQPIDVILHLNGKGFIDRDPFSKMQNSQIVLSDKCF